MKAAQLRDMTDAELQQKEREFKRELFNYRFQVSTGQQMNTAGLTATKRKIARVKTVLRQRQLAQEKTATQVSVAHSAEPKTTKTKTKATAKKSATAKSAST